MQRDSLPIKPALKGAAQNQTTFSDVSTPDKDWVEDEKRHELARSLREGREAMVRHAKAMRFMRPNPGEMELVNMGGTSDSQMDVPPGSGFSPIAPSSRSECTLYELRLERSDLPNPWRDSIMELARMPFSERIALEGWDEEIQGRCVVDKEGKVIEQVPGWKDDIDREGQSLDEWAAQTFEDALFEGVVFGFVDNDPRTFISVAARQQAKARPYCTRFKRCDIRRLTLGISDGLPPRLLQIVLFQPVVEQELDDPNNWSSKTIDAYKVVTAGSDVPLDEGALASFLAGGKPVPMRAVSTRVYVEGDDGKWGEDLARRGLIRPDNPLDEMLDIPLVPFYSERRSAFRGWSPFLNTAWTQNTIWNQNSELAGLAREASLTRVHISGYDPNAATAQPQRSDARNSRFTHSSDAASRMQIGEFRGSAARMIMEVIKWKSETIRQAHHRMASEKPRQPLTAREVTLDGVQASSTLEMWIIFQEKGWKKVLDLMALLGGLPKRGVVSIAHDFGLPASGADRNHESFVSGNMWAGNYWRESARAGDVDPRDFNVMMEYRMQALKLASDMGLGERIAAGDIKMLERLEAMVRGDKLLEISAGATLETNDDDDEFDEEPVDDLPDDPERKRIL